MSDATTEARIARRLHETAGAWMRPEARTAMATVVTEELKLLRDDMRAEFDARYAAKAHRHGFDHGRMR